MSDEYFTDEDVEEAVALLAELPPHVQAQALSELGFDVQLEEADAPITRQELLEALSDAEAEDEPEQSIWDDPELRQQFGEALGELEAQRGHPLTPREVERLAHDAFENQGIQPEVAAQRGAVHDLDDTNQRREWLAEMAGAAKQDEPHRDYGPSPEPEGDGESE